MKSAPVNQHVNFRFANVDTGFRGVAVPPFDNTDPNSPKNLDPDHIYNFILEINATRMIVFFSINLFNYFLLLPTVLISTFSDPDLGRSGSGTGFSEGLNTDPVNLDPDPKKKHFLWPSSCVGKSMLSNHRFLFIIYSLNI